MGLFTRKKPEPVALEFERWPSPLLPEYGLEVDGAVLHHLDVVRDGRYDEVIAQLLEQPGATYDTMLGRLEPTPSGIAVISWGQTIGAVVPEQSRSWRKRIEAVGDVWCTYHFSTGDNDQTTLFYVTINKAAL